MKDKRLKVARIEAGLTQFQVAVAAGVSEALVSKYETGRLTPPRDVQVRIAGALGKARWEVFQ